MSSEIRVTFPGGKKVDALVRGMTVHTDQPVAAGGEGTAPAPFDLFAASLATCAGLYVKAFCDARALPTEGLALRQRMQKDEAGQLVVELDIDLPPGFPEKYREALVRAAEGCAVKKAIDAGPRFVVRTVAAAGNGKAAPADLRH